MNALPPRPPTAGVRQSGEAKNIFFVEPEPGSTLQSIGRWIDTSRDTCSACSRSRPRLLSRSRLLVHPLRSAAVEYALAVVGLDVGCFLFLFLSLSLFLVCFRHADVHAASGAGIRVV